MTMTDPISDLLTRIRNGQMVRKPKIACPASKIKVLGLTDLIPSNILALLAKPPLLGNLS